MTYQADCTLPSELMEQLISDGLDSLPEMIRIIVNTAMQIERQRHLGVGAYERSAGLSGHPKEHANGYKAKQVTTRVGQIRVAVPQVREGDFYPKALEKGLRSERALTLTLAEMYVAEVSTRKVAAITEQLCGCAVSSSQVSHAVQQLDPVLEQWRQRPLGTTIYLWLDARYEKVRIDGQVRNAAVLIATGVNSDGQRQVLGGSPWGAVSLSEQEVHWRTFLQSLVARGLSGVQLIISDAHAGLKQARQAVFGGVSWQRCQFHLQQNAQAFVPRHEMKADVAAAGAHGARAIFNAANRTEADALLARTIQKYDMSASKLATWLETNLQEGLMVFAFPPARCRPRRRISIRFAGG